MMNHAQRSVLGSGLLMVAWVLVMPYLLPAKPTPPTPSPTIQWAGRIYLPFMLVVWWGGVRQFRRRSLSPERRTLVPPTETQRLPS
jgi:hypothetical protein